MKFIFHLLFHTTLLIPIMAQSSNGPSDFPDLVMTAIPGAPRLNLPILVANDTDLKPLVSQGFGLAAPAFYDWDGDELKDLLVGEFGSGAEFGKHVGNFIRVYANTGTVEQPTFTGGFNYAKPPFEILTNGTPYSVDQFCCLGFTPQFTDLNNDGLTDMVSGQYYGEVVSFYGSRKGFMQGVALDQRGDPRDRSNLKDYIKNQPYWLYSSASFGDFTGDGMLDLVVGGGALRISKNVGTLSMPSFDHRELLLDTDDQPLKIYKYTQEELAAFRRRNPYVAGDAKLSPVVVDWDRDGVLDLLVTNSYDHKGLSAIDFFRGVKKEAGHRFEPGVPLFTTKNGKKALPGCSPFVFVTDYNNDGVSDLLIGTSIVIVNNQFCGPYSWNWEEEMGLHGAGRDPGMLRDRDASTDIQWLLDGVTFPQGVSREDFTTMRHQGYVYVMLGSKNESVRATRKKNANENKREE